MNDEPRTSANVTVADATVVGDGFESLSPSRALLVVYEGDGADSRTRLIPLADGVEVSFGRSRSCTVVVDSDRVSRMHARLHRQGGDIIIDDLNSRNGTRVNGNRIDGPARLGSGDEIGVGPITAVLSVTSGMERHHALGEVADLDARLVQEADRGLRYQRSFALVMLTLRGQDQAIDGALDRVLAHLRPMDSMAEYSPEEYAVLLPEADLAAGAETGRTLLEAARQSGVDAEPIAVSAGMAVFPTHGSQAGAILSRARAALRQAESEQIHELVTAAAQDPTPESDEIVVADPQMQRVYALVRKVADTNMTVLILGETGAGKEIVAEAVHRVSARSDAPYVRLNCASIPESLLESELFGHEKGAFTGADRQRAGYFEAARGGTLFLDEIGELSAGLQAKLLRVLEERRITRVGGTREIAVDTRVVCATHRDLEAAVRSGNFREDLYFRISAFTVMVPPLRDRRSEIRPLAEYFGRRAAREHGGVAAGFSEPALEALQLYHWPGNVRELRNAVDRAYVLQEGGLIDLEHLPGRVREARALTGAGGASAGAPGAAPNAPVPAPGVDVREHIANIEREAIVAAMAACDGNQTRAARKLGMSRRSLIYKLEKYGLKQKPASRRRE